MHPPLTDEDVAYVQSAFRPQTEHERARAAAGLSAQPSYILRDGTAMVSAEPDEDLAEASEPQDLRRRFVARWVGAGGHEQAADPELAGWLNGGYGVCLRTPAPETILAKNGLAQAIEALIARPMPEHSWWQDTLHHAVDAYDALVLPFASVDSVRFGGTTSRERLVDAVRARWPDSSKTARTKVETIVR
jgi:uncharacterized protein DUF6058